METGLQGMNRQDKLVLWSKRIAACRSSEMNITVWCESTATKLKQVLQKILVENEYLDCTDADHLNPALVGPLLENAIRAGSCASSSQLSELLKRIK